MKEGGVSYFLMAFIVFLLLVGIMGLSVYYSLYYEGDALEGLPGNSIVCEEGIITVSNCVVNSVGIARISLRNNDVNNLSFSEVMFDFVNNGENVFLRKDGIVLGTNTSQQFILSDYRISYPTLVRISLNSSEGYYCALPGFVQCEIDS